GAGYRVTGPNNILVDLSGAISIRNYQAFDARVRWLQTSNRRAELWTDYGYDSFPQERYFGLGIDSAEGSRTLYGFRDNTVALRGLLRPASRVEIDAQVGYMNPWLTRGNSDEYP